MTSLDNIPESNVDYKLYPGDLDFYSKYFKPYLPTFTSSNTDIVLFLPVSYHLNPANYDTTKEDIDGKTI
jgi:hypothetical protein